MALAVRGSREVSNLQHSKLVQRPSTRGSVLRQVLQLVHVLIHMFDELGRWRLCPLLEVALERLFERKVGTGVQHLHVDVLRHAPLDWVRAAHGIVSVHSSAGR